MMEEQEKYQKLKNFIDSDHDCKCMDGSFDEFNNCCGKKFGITNPLEIFMDRVMEMSKKSSVPRLRDMEPEQAEKTLKLLMGLKK